MSHNEAVAGRFSEGYCHTGSTVRLSVLRESSSSVADRLSQAVVVRDKSRRVIGETVGQLTYGAAPASQNSRGLIETRTNSVS